MFLSQVICARGLTEARAAESCASLHTVLSALSQHPMDDTCVDDVLQAFTVCIAHADKLCGMAAESSQCLGLSAMTTSMQNCPRKLFLSKLPDVWNRVYLLARGNSNSVAEAASEAAVQMLKRLHTFMAAQGVKSIATLPVAQITSTALHLLQSQSALVRCGLGLMEAVLLCMPQAAKSQFQAACVASHAIMANLQLPIEIRLRAARVLAALPASQNSQEAHSQHLQGLLSALHASVSTIPAPLTDSQASNAAREALGDKLQGTWASCTMVPPAAASHHVPPSQRLDAITILMECLTETLSRRQVPPISVPVSPAILLVSRLVAHRPLHVPFSEEQFTAPERAELLLAGSPLLKAGLKLLRLLLLTREQLQPMAAALARLLSELLLDASTANRLPEHVRADLYATVCAALRAFGSQEVQPVLETLVPCAWAEFATPDEASGKGTAQSGGALKLAAGASATASGGGRRSSRRKRKACGGSDVAGTFGDTLDRVDGAVEHAHRPCNAQHVTSAQLQVDVDVFTVSALESSHWARHLVVTDARIHDVDGVAAVKHAATGAVAAMCRSGLRRNGQVPMADRIIALLQQQPRDPATEAMEDAALHGLSAAATLSAARKAPQSTVLTPSVANNTSASKSENRSLHNGAGVATGAGIHSTAGAAGARTSHGPAGAAAAASGAGAHRTEPRLDPEFEQLLSVRVASVMHRGLQLACGLGATGAAAHTTCDAPPIDEVLRGADAATTGHLEDQGDAQNVLEGGLGSGGAMSAPADTSTHATEACLEVQTEVRVSQPVACALGSGSDPIRALGGAAVHVAHTPSGSKALSDGLAEVPLPQAHTGSPVLGSRRGRVHEAPQSAAHAAPACSPVAVSLGTDVEVEQHCVPALGHSRAPKSAAVAVAASVDENRAEQKVVDDGAGRGDDSDSIPEIDSGPSDEDENGED